MEIDKKQLKIISMEFRTIANRLINCHWRTGMDLLKKFISFIDGNELISNYVKGYVNPADFEPVERGTCYISMGDTKEQEISCTYQYLKFSIESFNDYYRDICWQYAKEANDSVKEFNDRIILPFVNYIESYLTEIGIQMGYDEDIKYVINVTGGIAQVNLANDSGIVNATQKNGLDLSQLNSLIASIKASITDDIDAEDIESLHESIEVIENELAQMKPKKSLIKTALNTMKAITGTAEFAAAVAALYQFIQTL